MPKSYDHAIMGSYLKKKHFAYSQLTGTPQPAYWFMTTKDLETVLNALAGRPGFGGYRVYFGYAPADATPDHLKTYAGQMLLIFTATDDAGNDLFKATPGTPFFVVTQAGVVQLTHDQASALVAAYQNTILPLSRALMTAVLTKQGRPAPTVFPETKSVTFDPAWKNGLFDAIAKYDIKGLTFFLGAYTDDCGDDDATRYHHQNTFVVNFAETFEYNGATYYYHYDIENVPGYEKPVNDPAGGGGVNTINPCPPNVCSGASLPIN